MLFSPILFPMKFIEIVPLIRADGTELERVPAARAQQIVDRGLGVARGSRKRWHCVVLCQGVRTRDLQSVSGRPSAALHPVDCYRSEFGSTHILRRLRHGALVPWPAFSRPATV